MGCHQVPGEIPGGRGQVGEGVKGHRDAATREKVATATRPPDIACMSVCTCTHVRYVIL